MLPLRLAKNGTDAPLQVLCLGAHSDDIEIGCGGTALRLAATVPRAEFTWVVLSGDATRAEEARRSAALFAGAAAQTTVVVKEFRDGFFPYAGAEIKDFFEALKREVVPDIIFTHYRGDQHQDHRLVSELTWNTFRGHLVLEYEVPKYDGDLGRPNLYVPLSRAAGRIKVRHLLAAFGTQRGKRWFTADTFDGLLRLRGIETGTPDGYAEAFYA